MSENEARIAALKEKFLSHFGMPPAFVSRSPGRVNLIGEHTDYNGGFVFPVAINATALIAVAPAENGAPDGEVRVKSDAYPQEAVFNLREIVKAPAAESWSNYVRGVAWALSQRGLLDLSNITGARFYIESNVPQGAGLSSSAALEIASALAFLQLAGQTVEESQRPAIALACQLAENGFVGANTGIMDQFISALGQPDSALLLDTRSLQYQAVPLHFSARGWKLVAVDSAVKHRHDTGGYNTRRQECEEAARKLAEHFGAAQNAQLRDFTLEQLNAIFETLPDKPARRARHVITEDARTLRVVALLERGFSESGDVAEFGRLLRGSHNSLRDDFEVTVPETDRLVELAYSTPGVVGARMTGGGFGGCTVNVVEETALETFRQNVVEQYRAETGHDAKMYIFDGVQGGSILA
jgi:galactokinase